VIKIRQVDGSDDEIGEVLRDLHLSCFGDTAPQIDPPLSLWWLAYHDGMPMAFGGMERSKKFADVGYLCRSGVLPGYRGQGLQLRLIRAREAKARKLGWVWMRTDTTGNPASGNTLIRAGYRLFTPETPWAFDHSIYWRKKLV
jgi:GNAT superfamily N-acetyltransferase